MKNYIEELKRSISRKEQEKAALQNQITSLQDQCAAEADAKQEALANGDNAAYLIAYRKIQDYENQIKGLQALIADKEKVSLKPEIIKALNAEITNFEEDRRKTIKRYFDAKHALAEMFVDACRAEDDLKKTRSEYMTIGGIDEYSGEVKGVNDMEPKHIEAARFFKDELIEMGYDFGAIMTGHQGF